MSTCLSFAAIGQAKNVEMFGKIMDHDMKPIPNVTIALKGTGFKTKTDSLGHYKFILPPSEGKLIYSHADYVTREEKFTGTPQATDLILVAKKQDK
jgi:hypothetical protein